MGIVEDLAEARAAFERHDWLGAVNGFADAAELSADDLNRLGIAAYLRADESTTLRAMQQAYQAKIDAGDRAGAARCGFWVALALRNRGEQAVAAGWVARVQRLVEEEPGEAGYLEILLMFQQILSGNFAEAFPHARAVTDHGRRTSDPNLLAMGLSSEGRLLLEGGQVREGLALLDEAMAAVAAGEVMPAFAGEVYCSMIEACQLVSDLGRASDWTRALTGWCDTQPGLVAFTGQCAVHRGQIMSARGAFREALEEYALAQERYIASGGSPAAGLALSEAGDVQRLLGDYEAAEQSYDRAAEHGHEPQPGLALLWLARGRTVAAVAAIRRLLAESPDPVPRARLLPAAVEILCAADETEEAALLADELTRTAASFGSTALLARSAYASAVVAIARSDPAGALPYLRRASAQWSMLEARYEVARCRWRIGEALAALGDQESARAELTAARTAFRELGARPAETAVAQLLEPSLPSGLTEREVEVLRLVAGGRSNSEIAAALVLSEKTVARHLSNIFTKIEVGSRTAAAAFAFEHHLV